MMQHAAPRMSWIKQGAGIAEKSKQKYQPSCKQLGALVEADLIPELEGTRYQLRTTMQGAALHAFHAAGVRPPASITQLASNS